jgi:hypothetical protein
MEAAQLDPDAWVGEALTQLQTVGHAIRMVESAA